jgi:hypothetical protein
MRAIAISLLIGLSVLMGGCSSIVEAIIGEQPVDNLFGLDGREIVFSIPQTSLVQESPEILSPAQLQDIPITVPLPSIAVNDLEDLNIPLGATPKSASEELGLNGTLTVTSASPETEFPETLGLKDPALELMLTDDSGAPSISQQLQGDVEITFTKTTCESEGATTVCTYQAPEPEYYFLTLAFEGEDFETLFNDILQGGDPSNTVTGSLALLISATGSNLIPVPLDSSFKLTLETRNGKIDFTQ